MNVTSSQTTVGWPANCLSRHTTSALMEGEFLFSSFLRRSTALFSCIFPWLTRASRQSEFERLTLEIPLKSIASIQLAACVCEGDRCYAPVLVPAHKGAESADCIQLYTRFSDLSLFFCFGIFALPLPPLLWRKKKASVFSHNRDRDGKLHQFFGVHPEEWKAFVGLIDSAWRSVMASADTIQVSLSLC